MINLINQYLKSKENIWSGATLKSERARLQAVAPLLQQSNKPEYIYDELVAKDKGPYTIKTTFIRLVDFYKYQDSHLSNEYSNFMRINSRRFKQAYKTKHFTLTYKEIFAKIETEIKDEHIKKHARLLLNTGLRASESARVADTTNNLLVGKGDKERPLFFIKEVERHSVSYSKLYRALKKIGLTPHMLRKVFATELVNKGLKEADLCKVMGWESFATAGRYIQPKRDEELRGLIKQIGDINENK